MPGGDVAAWNALQTILEAISAKVNGESHVLHIWVKTPQAHYVKMVPGSIEYAIMQLLTEVYDVLKRGLGFKQQPASRSI